MALWWLIFVCFIYYLALVIDNVCEIMCTLEVTDINSRLLYAVPDCCH